MNTPTIQFHSVNSFTDLRLRSLFDFDWRTALALAAIAPIICLSPAQANPISRVEYSTPFSQSQTVYGAGSVYSSPVPYSSVYRSGGLSITVGGYSNDYPYTYPSFPRTGSGVGSIVVTPQYRQHTQYPTGRINGSVLVNPTVVNSPIYNSTLINPNIIEKPRYRGRRHRGQSNVIRYQLPLGTSGIASPIYPPYPYPIYEGNH